MPNIQYMPFNQFEGVPIFLGQMGSGSGIQPFNTVKDYENWIIRAGKFQAWTDSAIVYFRRGLQNGYILPRCLVEKMIPEMQDMVVTDITKSIFYTPLTLIPAAFPAADQANHPFQAHRYHYTVCFCLPIKSWPISCRTSTCLKAAAVSASTHYQTEINCMIS